MKPTINLARPLPPLRLLASYLLSHPRLFITLVFLAFWLVALFQYYSISTHDPSSAFFSENHGYDKAYSFTRESEALSFIANASDSPTATSPPPSKPSLCLGVATVARPNTQYITHTIGSLLEGLTPEERAQIHFIFFVAHTDPQVHPVYQEAWTRTLPDTQLTYIGLPAAQMAELRKWEQEKDYRSKGLFDYSHLLGACYERTSAPYVGILEGDVLAVRGWYSRAIAAAEHIDALDPADDVDASVADSGDSPTASWLYLRLFYTETYLGWNEEEWPSYLFCSVLTFLVTTSSLIALRAIFPYALSRPLSNPNIALITLAFLPLSIALYFALGRSTISPLPQPPPAGLQKMPNFGCCSQGFIIPRRMVPFLRRRIEERVVDYIDMMMEAIAGKWGLERWTVNPSLLQHIGGSSSKGDEIADDRARMIWSFGFERWPSEGAGGL